MSKAAVLLGAALVLQSVTGDEVVLSGPAGTGKSYGCLVKLHRIASETPGLRAAILRKTRASLTTTGLVTFEQHVLGLDHPLVANGPTTAHRNSYRYSNGSEIVVGGLDKAEKVLSSEYDVIYVQQTEECTEHDWELLSTRLRNGRLPYQQMIGDCNPDAPTHWLRRRADTGRMLMLESRHEDNPTMWDRQKQTWTERGKAYIARLDRLTGVRYRRLRLGQWAAAEGAVYETWDRAIHLIPRFEIPVLWRRIRVIDFGYTNAFVCQWWAIDGDGRMFRYREIYRTGRIVADHAEQIKKLSEVERIEATICDHDAEDRATLHAHGIFTVPAYKAVSRGIEAVQERLLPAGDGKPRLFYLEDSLVEADETLIEAGLPYATEHEYDGYVWPKGADGKPNKEVPVQADDHGLDATRYGVAYVDNLQSGVGDLRAATVAGARRIWTRTSRGDTL